MTTTEPVNPASAAQESTAKETIQEKQDKLLGTLDQRLAQVDPAATKPPPNWWQRIVGGVILILIIGLLLWVVLVAVGLIPTLGWGKGAAGESHIELISTQGEYIVFLVKQADEGEVKLINSKTGAVTDISLGDKHASNAALSAQGSVVAYVSTINGSSLYLVNSTGGITQVFASSKLNETASSFSSTEKIVKVCEWSKLFWSPEGKQLAFFGCSAKSSALFVVSTQLKSTPVLIPDTVNMSTSLRQVVWLTEEQIVITSGNQPRDSIVLINLNQKQSQRLYGPLD